MADQAIPEPPGYIKSSARALERWNELWTCLEGSRIKPALHRDFVGQYCVAYADMRDALEKLEKGKLVAEKRTVGVGDKAKTTVEKWHVHPFQSIYDNAVRNMERLGRMLGLDPINPLEETRTLADYADNLIDMGEDEDSNVDDGTSVGGQPGDAGSPTPGGSGDAVPAASPG